MKSPLALTSAFVATAITVIGYFAASVSSAVDQSSVAIGLFIGAILAPLIIKAMAGEKAEVKDIKTLYVGNLPYRANEATVRSLFSEYGLVHSVRLMKDKQTGKRRGFGFVEISAADAGKAISSLNDTEFQQRTLKVREAKERPEPSPQRG
ncbi:RNA-binding protein [Thalassotalea sp. HSM 43]|uniref:RNA recognition motif domain-containing protein n=1 Tax=Thalassotalea sp. HSM 43 TaxID=2552945 RepID=UPI001080F2DD|nr:RNA-binding protein [Thalassotalea sp. HSM 43]QBY04719.1 RNA-binding protein [Thalassotalea sp. HSM 43]